MASYAVVDPGECNDEAWGSYTSDIQTHQNSGFVAVGQGDNEDRADNVGDKPSCSNVSSMVRPSLEGQGACPDCYDFYLRFDLLESDTGNGER